jgi:hypothetical protein
MTSLLRKKRRITRRSFLLTSEAAGLAAPGSAGGSGALRIAVAIIVLAVALPLHADEVTRLKWGNAPTPVKKSTGSTETSTSLKFVKPAVGGGASSVSSSKSDANIRLAAWEASGDAPRLTSGRESESAGRSVIVNRNEDSADGIRSAQLPPANTNNNNSKVEDGLRSPFSDNAEPPQPNALPMPGDNAAPALPAPENSTIASPPDSNTPLQNQQIPQHPDTAGQFQPVLPSGPGPDQSPPSSAQSDSTVNIDRAKAKESCSKSLQNLRAYTVDKVDLKIVISGTEGEDYPIECSIDDGTMHAGRCWEQTTYMWKASAMCHKPLYFEDEQLERYGHSFSPCIQPFVSGAHFFTHVPVLPYCMGVEPPNECIYALGHYRPGDCAPYMCNPIPISPRGALFEAGAVVGTAAAIP